MKSTLLLLWRDLRSGELSILVFSLLLATATVTSISLFTSRIQNSILDEATQFLAADVQIRSTVPQHNNWEELASTHNLRTAKLISFRAMAFTEQGMQLVAVKAATEEYPLKGAVTLAKQPFGKGEKHQRGPAQGEVWLASRLFAALHISPGDTISIGDKAFIASRALIKEPDSPQSFFGVAPRAIINLADVEATGAVQTGSRVNYSLLLAGTSEHIQAFKDVVEPQLGHHNRWVGVKQGNRNIGDALERAEKFLLLAGSLSVLLSGVAIALAARRYAIRQSTSVALLKTFGQTPSAISRRYISILLILGISSVFLGSITGWLLHNLILQILGSLLPRELSQASTDAFATGAISGFVTLFAFAAPPLLSLRNVPPAAVLRQGAANGIISPRIAAAIGFVCVVALIFGYSESVLITAVLAAGGIVTLAGGGVLAWGILALGKLVSNKLGNAWRLGLSNLKRHQGFNAVQIVIFSTLIMLLLILIDTRTSLIGTWQKQLPENTPNHFLFNIFNEEKPKVEALLAESNFAHSPFYPMMRGRLIMVNAESVMPRVEATSSHMNYQRELNLTWATALGKDNSLVKGDWHGDDESLLTVSAEAEYANGIQLAVGDTLTFSVAGQEVTAILGSIRSVQWDSMNPNFFMIFNQPLLDNTATNWLTSVYLPAGQKTFLNQLARDFPTTSIIELDQMITQMQSIIHQVSLAVEFILVLVLAAGILVLITSIQATLDIRFQESAILRTLGARRRFVNQVLIIEFCSLGCMAGLLGTLGAQISLYFIQTQVFKLDFTANPLIILSGPAGGAILIGLIGWLSARKVTLRPPLTILRALE